MYNNTAQSRHDKQIFALWKLHYCWQFRPILTEISNINYIHSSSHLRCRQEYLMAAASLECFDPNIMKLVCCTAPLPTSYLQADSSLIARTVCNAALLREWSYFDKSIFNILDDRTSASVCWKTLKQYWADGPGNYRCLGLQTGQPTASRRLDHFCAYD